MAAPKGNRYAVGNKGGRPPKYDTKYCEEVIELGKAGKSPTQISVGIGVPRTTMLTWAKEIDEFSSALTRANEFSQDWWETQGQMGLTADKFNAQLWSKSMSARFREDYTERKEVKQEVSVEENTSRDAIARIIFKEDESEKGEGST